MTNTTEQAIDELIDQIGNKYMEVINLSDTSWHDYKQTAKQAINEQLIRARIEGKLEMWDKIVTATDRATVVVGSANNLRKIRLEAQAELNQQESKEE